MESALKETIRVRKNSGNVIRLNAEDQLQNALGVRIGRIVGVKDSGQVTVDYPGNESGALSARSVVDISPDDPEREVLLVFEKNQPHLPVITGFIKENPVAIKETVLDAEAKKEVTLDGERLVLEAKAEIELRCGKSSILMKEDGKVVIKGVQIVSRSSGTNKIKGASVQIN